MKRKIYNELLEWKNTSRGQTALLIEGARRVGKSYIVEEFVKNNYESYILIDFAFAPQQIKDLFENYADNLDMLFMYLQEYYEVKLKNRASAIIFDEIQFCPKARSLIKHLVLDRRYDYLETGSLISIHKNVKDILIPSEERKITMHPMDFEEFLWAMGNDTLMSFIKTRYEKRKPVTDILHRKALDYFKQYLIIGGMPQVVLKYLETKDFRECDIIKRDLIALYRDDIKKHSDELNLKVEKIFDTIPSQLQKHEKKFNLSALDKEARYRTYEGAFYWLKDAGLINIANNTTEPNIGLGQRIDDNSMKCYFFDTGLLLSMVFDENEIINAEIYKKILYDKLAFNNGMILENIVAQALVASRKKLYFFSKNNNNKAEETMEIDFLIQKQTITSKHNIIPIEVKSGDRYTYSSLNKLRNKYKDYLDEAIIVHTKDLKEENNILYIPIYMVGLL